MQRHPSQQWLNTSSRSTYLWRWPPDVHLIFVFQLIKTKESQLGPSFQDSTFMKLVAHWLRKDSNNRQHAPKHLMSLKHNFEKKPERPLYQLNGDNYQKLSCMLLTNYLYFAYKSIIHQMNTVNMQVALWTLKPTFFSQPKVPLLILSFVSSRRGASETWTWWTQHSQVVKGNTAAAGGGVL